MNKFTIYVYAGLEVKPKEVDGKEVSVSPFLSAFIHRSIEKRASDGKSNWVVSERTTGHSIVADRTQKKAIEQARELLRKKSREEIEAKIIEARTRLPISQ